MGGQHAPPLTKPALASSRRVTHALLTLGLRLPVELAARGRVPAAAGSVGHSGRVTEVEGACLFLGRRGASIGGAGRRGGAGIWVSQWFEVWRKRGTGRGRAYSRAAWGSPSPGTQVCGVWNAKSGGGGGRVREMAARWSSENVVVEFRDSQVSRGPNGALWACAFSDSPPPRCRVRLPVVGATLQPGLGDGSGVTRSCQTRASEGSLDDRWGRLGRARTGYGGSPRGYGE